MLPGTFINREDLELATLAWPGTGTPLYLVHATGFCGALWDPIARAVSAETAPRAMDVRGQGRSSKPDRDYPWQLFADDLLDWIRSEGGGPIFAMGHSSGATAVALAAAQEPERFARILLIDPTILPPPAERTEDERRGGFGLADRAAKRRGSFDSRQSVRESYHERFPFSSWDPRVFELYLEHAVVEDGDARLRCPPELESRIYLGTAAIDPWPELEMIRARTRIVLPEHSGLRPELQRRLEQALPHAEIVRTEGTHFVPMEHPDLIGQLALEHFS
jgi:pimeloyl-ACP methyl ester carboxylesterase